VALQQALVMGHVVLERLSNLSYADDDQSHGGCDTRPL
jgi:hypothetical protein